MYNSVVYTLGSRIVDVAITLGVPLGFLWAAWENWGHRAVFRGHFTRATGMKPVDVPTLLASPKNHLGRWVEVLDYPDQASATQSPITMTTCVWWRCLVLGTMLVATRRGFGTYEVTLADVSSENTNFDLGKAPESLALNVERSEIIGHQSFFWTSLGKIELPEKVRLFVDSCLVHHPSYLALQDFHWRASCDEPFTLKKLVETRYIEQIIPLGEPVYVFGKFHNGSGGKRYALGGRHPLVCCQGEAAAEKILKEREHFSLWMVVLAVLGAVAAAVGTLLFMAERWGW